jgi:Holliday junction resolvasome RuvABC endonuclease subunit
MNEFPLAPLGSFRPLYVLGLDPGFASIGLCVYAVGPNPQDDRPVKMTVFRTSKASAKRKVRASDDNLERAKEIASWLNSVVSSYDIKIICAETMSFPRSSSVAAKMAMCWGVIAAFSALKRIPVTQASPQEIKKTMCQDKSASKEEVQASLNLLFRADLVGPNGLMTNAGIPATQLEHPYDALAAVVACRDSAEVLLLRRMVECAASTESSLLDTSPIASPSPKPTSKARTSARSSSSPSVPQTEEA